jgi:hypothetical protein
VKLIPHLKRAVPTDVQSVEVLGRGSGLHWESLDLVPNGWPNWGALAAGDRRRPKQPQPKEREERRSPAHSSKSDSLRTF